MGLEMVMKGHGMSMLLWRYKCKESCIVVGTHIQDHQPFEELTSYHPINQPVLNITMPSFTSIASIIVAASGLAAAAPWSPPQHDSNRTWGCGEVSIYST